MARGKGEQLSRTVLAINCGSSSLKFGLYNCSGERPQLVLEGEGEDIGRAEGKLWFRAAQGEKEERDGALPDHDAVVQRAFQLMEEKRIEMPAAVGHRVVHGGREVRTHCLLTAEVRAKLQEAIEFAPLHVPPALKAIDAVSRHFPNAKGVACLDVAFHSTMPDVSRCFALPASVRDLGVERYGFHGLSLESILPRLRPVPSRLVVAHLGGGCSVTAIRDGRSIDTTMGLTPSGGMMMGTRSGDLDPGILLFLLRKGWGSADALEILIDHDSGLMGVSGLSSDYRMLAEQRRSNPQADLALRLFSYHLRKQVASMAAAMGGIDALVLTGGIGEHNPQMLDELRRELPFLGAFQTLALASEEDFEIAAITSRLVWN